MNAKRWLKTTATLCAFCVLFALASAVLRRRDSYTKFRPFFEDGAADYDVYFMGTSHVLNGVDPMQLWHDWGITSYNLGWNCNTIPADYWQLRLAAKRHKPKVVVIDILGMHDDTKIDYGSNYVFAHGILDPFPLSLEKVRAVRDLFGQKKTRFEFYLPFALYHNRWQELSAKKVRANFRNYVLGGAAGQPTNGYDPKVGVRVPQSFCPHIPDYAGRETVAFAYARKTIAYCRENGIIPVFMHLPFSAQEKMGAWKAAFERVLLEEDVAFIDMSDAVDFSTDQYDLDYHLNTAGARKVTGFIGARLRALGVAAHEEGAVAEKWNAAYGSYLSYYDSLIRAQADIGGTLSLLSHPGYRTQILVANGFDFGETEQKQIAALGNAALLVRAKARQDYDVSIEVFRAESGERVTEKCYRSEFVAAE